MTAQGSAATRYRRAIETRSLFLAELAAREMGHLPLGDAVGLLELYAAGERRKYERAAVRWLARFGLEGQRSLVDMQVAAAALQALPTVADEAGRLLRAIVR